MFVFKEIEKSFDGLNVLKGINLIINLGEKIGVTGGNGTGKSTFLNIATGFINPDRGLVSFNGINLNKIKPWQISRMGVKRSFQTARMSPNLTMREQFFISKDIVSNSSKMIEQAGLTPYLDKFPQETPLPVLRKVEVVRALLSAPKIIFLDEPSAGLTSAEQNDFAIFLNLFLGNQTSLIIIEHQLNLIKRVTRNIIQLKDGLFVKRKAL